MGMIEGKWQVLAEMAFRQQAVSVCHTGIIYTWNIVCWLCTAAFKFILIFMSENVACYANRLYNNR